MRLHFGGRDFAFKDPVTRLVPRKQPKVHPIGLVTAAGVGNLGQWNLDKRCAVHALGSKISIWAGTRWRGIRVGQMPSNSLVLFRP